MKYQMATLEEVWRDIALDIIFEHRIVFIADKVLKYNFALIVWISKSKKL